MLAWRLRRVVLLFMLLALVVIQSSAPLSAASTTLVISEFRTRGPSGGNDEFIELRNVSAGPINLSGWNVLGSNGSGLTEVRANLPNISLNAGCSFLLTNSNTNGYSGGVPGDQTYAVGITDDGGIAVQAPGGALVDQVGLSGGSAYGEGTRLGNFGSSNSNRSYQRQGADTDNNAANFTLISPSQPTNAGGGCTGGGTPTPTNPSGTGASAPISMSVGGTVLLTVSVTPGTNPTSTGLNVTANLSSVGGGAAEVLFDTGMLGDQAGGDNVFSRSVTVGGNTAAGAKSLPFTITDGQGRSGTGAINLTVQATTSTNPSGTGRATPSPVQVGATVVLEVTVTPGVSPASTGLVVRIDARAIGGPNPLQTHNDGPLGGCDFVAGDNIFNACFPIPFTVSPGSKTLPVTIEDAQGRIGSASIAVSVTPATDTDTDGLPDVWEQQFGLSATSGTGSDGASGDPDADGLTNLQEFQQQSHPKGTFTRYLAEGATSDFFDARLALLNADTSPRSVLMRFLRSDGQTLTHFVALPAQRRATVHAKTIGGLETAEFSTVIEADGQIVVDRTMTWDQRGYGSHAETAVASPETTWYLAEGATHSGFNLFYLLQNPNPAAASVQVTYLLPAPAAPVVRNYAVAGNSRFTIWVDLIAELENTDVSAVISSDQPIIVERAMYLDAQGLPFGAGHESAGVTAPATSWFLAEGATGPFFDLFVLIANPNPTDVAVTATYYVPSGAVFFQTHIVRANSRFNIWVDLEEPFPTLPVPLLADTAVSIVLSTGGGPPVIVERSMWWPGSSATWHEAHNTPGATQMATKWALADGEVGGPTELETYILIAHTSAGPTNVDVTLLLEGGGRLKKSYTLSGNSRFNVSVKDEFPAAVNQRFGAVIESIDGTEIVVERAMYSNAEGVIWAAGTNALGTPLTSVP